MASGSLVRDQGGNLIKAAHRTAGKDREYEFTMPLKNTDLGDALWERDQTYMIALLVGPGQEYRGVSEDVWMSDQILIRIGSPSRLSMYVPAHGSAQEGGKSPPRGDHSY